MSNIVKHTVNKKNIGLILLSFKKHIEAKHFYTITHSKSFNKIYKNRLNLYKEYYKKMNYNHVFI